MDGSSPEVASTKRKVTNISVHPEQTRDPWRKRLSPLSLVFAWSIDVKQRFGERETFV
jgi:hypothetical protein